MKRFTRLTVACVVLILVPTFICSGCKSSSSVSSNRSINEKLSSIEIPAITPPGMELGMVVEYLSGAVEEHGWQVKDEGKNFIVFECSDALLERQLGSDFQSPNRPLGCEEFWFMSMSDYIMEVCMRARVGFVIEENRGFFVEKD